MVAKNNVFNIRANGSSWIGMTGARKGFVEFDNREHAIRAWLILMRTYRKKYDRATIRRIVERFAPPRENDTEKYIRFCEQQTGLGAETRLMFNSDYCHLGKAMARMETGTDIRPSDIRTVMEKFNVYPAGYGHI